MERAFRKALRDVLHGSLPREVGVEVGRIRKGKGRSDVLYVPVELIVHKDSLKGTLIGKGGSTVKRIGTRARKILEKELGKKVYVDVRVVKDPERSPVNRWFEIRSQEDVFECPAVKHPQVTRVEGSKIRGSARIAAFAEVIDSTVHGGTMVSNRAVVRSSVLHKRVTVSSHCEIANSELHPLTFVGDGTQVRGSMVGERCFVGMNASIKADIGRWSVVGAGARVEDDVPSSSLVLGEGKIVDSLTLYVLELEDERAVLKADGRVVDSGEGRVYVVYRDGEIVLSSAPTRDVLCLAEKVQNRWRVRGKGFERVAEAPTLHWYVGEERGLLR